MIDNFEKLREKLHLAIEKNGINSEKVKKLSARFDKLVNSYYKNQKQYNEYSIMYIKYEESLEELRKISRDFAKFPSIAEWNKYAVEKDLLCTESIKYISGINWHNLRNRIMLENNKKS